MSWPLQTRALDLRERMDDPACDLQKLNNTFRQFALINRIFSGWRRIYRVEIRPRLAGMSRPGRLLDIGCGGGDIPRQLWKWAKADGRELQVTGIDSDPRAVAFARGRSWPEGFQFRQTTSRQLVRESAEFDFIISNNLLHHLDAADLSSLLEDASALSRGLIVFNDIRRSPLAYGLFPLATGLFFYNSFVVADGLTSIRRSYTLPELRSVAPSGWKVQTMFPYRLLLMHQR